MKVLTQPFEIRAAIRDLLSDPTDERIVVVAFVGADASVYLPAASGVSVYCWPKAGGTNPYAIEELRDAGANVMFVDRLHAKVYWSRKYGALVGSANLSNNALGESGLREYVLRLAVGALDVRPFVRTLRPIEDLDAALKQLHVDHIRFQQRNYTRGTFAVEGKPLPTFADWLRRGEAAADWRLGWYELDSSAPRDAVKTLEEKTGSAKYVRFLGVASRNALAAGVPTLGIRVRQQKAGHLRLGAYEWWVPAVCIKTAHKSWKDYPYVWFALRSRMPPGARAPFDVAERRFQIALTAAVNAIGIEDLPVKTQGKFVKLLSEAYKEG